MIEKIFVSYWDSLIVATALEAGCNQLSSEDMQHGQIVYGLKIHNIFR
jgi:predicted nucleic acid-binding protein